MRRLIVLLVSTLTLLVCAGVVHAQDILVPAGTLLQCTMDEPNFSSKTAAVGDPVLCHLRTLREFNRQVFPRGAMLGGHLEEDKDPGRFWGKGYLKITFDRVILPSGDLPVPAKVIAARGYKVDKQGDIDGKGHAKRDVVEWMIPPLWPWKVLMLPARGPRPTLKGEEPMQLRLMDDIVVPSTMAFGPNRPPWANQTRPSSYSAALKPNAMQPAVDLMPIPLSNVSPQPPASNPIGRFTTIVLKSNQVCEVTRYQINGKEMTFRQLNGTEGSVDVSNVDWLRTTEMSAGVKSVDMPEVARQIN
jgi:hypothetical protein